MFTLTCCDQCHSWFSRPLQPGAVARRCSRACNLAAGAARSRAYTARQREARAA